MDSSAQGCSPSPWRTRPGSRELTAVLPASGATLARSLAGGLVLVAHTGNAHLGRPVDRPLLRDLARAQGRADRAFYGSWAREQPAGSACSGGVTGGDAGVAFIDLPEAIPFRHATAHTFSVSGHDIHLTLHATRDPVKPDVHVELRMSRPLLTRLAQYQHRLLHRARIAALVTFLVALGAFVALVAMAT
jgi:hypothetical protein